MADIVSSEMRSRMMAGIRGENTKPEMIIRKGLFALGFRFRLHSKHLPGKPDIVLAKYRAAIFVHGCFWHGHDCHLFKWPQSKKEFWRTKINRNRERDREVREGFEAIDWRRLVVWECAIKGKSRLGDEKVVEQVCRWICGNKKYYEIRGSI